MYALQHGAKSKRKKILVTHKSRKVLKKNKLAKKYSNGQVFLFAHLDLVEQKSVN